MAKVLRTAAVVVGAAALIATGIGAAGGAGLLGASVAAGGSIAGIATAATFTAIGSIAGLAAGLMSLGSMALAGKPPPGTVAGNPTKFTIEKQSGIPYSMGRTLVGGRVAHRQFYGPKNVYESWVSVLSLGPVKSIGPLLIDKLTPVLLAGGAATGAFAGHMWLDTQLGKTPEVRALAGPVGAIPGWDSTSKLSGLAADLWTLKWDKEGKTYPTGVPVRARVVEGVLVYDPRLDGSYPGGIGTCRLGDEATYVYSENPACHAVTWAFGRYQNSVLVAGGGLTASGIDMPSFVEWANVCDANGWKVGGTIFTEADNSWDVLRMIAQAGGGECVPVGARLSAVFSAPRVSIGSITSNDICGPVDVPATAASRVRRNTIIPKVRLEAQGWEMTPLDPVSVPEYVALDGASRPRELDFPLVQDADQGAELALYAMLNDRELDGISIAAKVYALGYRPGDCLTLDIPEANLIGRDVILRERDIDAASMAVTLTCRSETREKHAYALGQSGTPPRTPDLSNPGIDRSAPDAADWSIAADMRNADNVPTPFLIVTGSIDERTADAVVFDYRPYVVGADPDANWTGASIEPATVTRREITGLEAGRSYQVGVRYRTRGALSERLILGPVATPRIEVPISFTVGSQGNGAIVPANYLHGLRNADGAPIATDYRRSYTASYYSADTGAWTSRSFDVYGAGAIDYGYGAGVGNGDAASGSDAGSMARYLNAIPAGLPVVVFTSDEPRSNRLDGGLREAMYRCGASAAKFGGDGNAFPLHAAYILVGTAGAGEGNAAIERVQEAGVDSSTNAWLMTSFTIVNGVLQLGARDGSDGRDGTDGLPGAPGATSYVHFAYANSPTGTIDFTVGAPEDRAYIGTYTDFFPTDSADPAAYTWTQYKGPPSFGLFARGDAVVAGSSVIKNGPSEAWDSDAFSTEGYRGGAILSFRPGSNNGQYFMAGLNGDPSADTNYTSIDYAWFLAPGGEVIAYESGVGVQQFFVGYSAHTVFQIAYDGRKVRYLVDGEPVREVDAGSDRLFFFDCSIAGRTSRITDISFAPAGTAGVDGSAGAPGAPGPAGQTSYVHYAYANSGDGQVDFTTDAPGGRTWEGSYTDFTQADSGNPAAYTWREYKGPPFGMAARGGAVVAGDSIIKRQDWNANWDSDAYSTVGSRGSAKASFKFPAGDAMAGLNTDPTANGSYTSIDFAWYAAPGSGIMEIYEGGAFRGSQGGWSPSAVYSVEYDGQCVTYTIDGVPARQVYVGPDKLFFFDSSLLNPGTRITNVQFTAGAQRPSGLTLVPLTGSTITGANSVRIFGNVGGWGSGKCYSRERFSSGAVAEWRAEAPYQADWMAGLAQNGTASTSYDDITFAMHVNAIGYVGAYINGNGYASGPSVPTDQPVRGKVAYDGKRWVRWYLNDVEFAAYEWGENADALCFAAALASTNPTLTDIAFSKAGKSGNDGNNGTNGAPGAPGANGLTPYFHTAYANSPDGSIDFVVGAPGGRAFIGTYVDYNPADSVNPNSYRWAQYKGPAAFGLAATGSAVVASNAIVLVGSQGGWGGASGFSTEGFRAGAAATFKMTPGTMGGLNTDPFTDNHWTSLDYAMHNTGNEIQIYESGGYYGNYANGSSDNVCQIIYNNKTVQYWINGFLQREVAAPENLTLFFDTALFGSAGNKVFDIGWTAAGTAGNNGQNGQPGAPGSPGTPGTDGFIVSTETDNFIIPVYSSGALKPGWAGGVGTINLTKGGSFITAGVGYGVHSAVNITGLAISSNQFSFQGIAGNAGSFFIRASYNGVNYDRRIDVKKVYDGEAAFQNTANTSGQVSSNTLTITSSTPVPGGRACVMSAVANYSMAAPGQYTEYRPVLAIYWRNVTDGGPWNLLAAPNGSIASVINNGTPQEPQYQYTPGSASASASFTAPSPDKQIGFEARLTRDYGVGTVNASMTVKLEVSNGG